MLLAVAGAGRRSGSALIGVLWFVVVIAALTLEFSIWGRHARNTAAAELEYSRGKAAAFAAVAHAEAVLNAAVLEMAETGVEFSPTADPWSSLSRAAADTVPMDRDVYRLDIVDTGARLNLNTAGADDLRRFLIGLGLAEEPATVLAFRVIDWRDPDNVTVWGQPETAEYIEADSPVLPKNESFARTDELRNVLGMTEALYEMAAPHLTLLGRGYINLNTASLPVLLSLPGMTLEAALVALTRQAEGRPIVSILDLADELTPEAREELEAVAPELVARTNLETAEVEIVATGWAERSSVRATMRAVITRSGTTVSMNWRRIE